MTEFDIRLTDFEAHLTNIETHLTRIVECKTNIEAYAAQKDRGLCAPYQPVVFK